MIHLFDNIYLSTNNSIEDENDSSVLIGYDIYIKADEDEDIESHIYKSFKYVDGRNIQNIYSFRTIKEAIRMACKYKVKKIIQESDNSPKEMSFSDFKKELNKIKETWENLPDWL